MNKSPTIFTHRFTTIVIIGLLFYGIAHSYSGLIAPTISVSPDIYYTYGRNVI